MRKFHLAQRSWGNLLPDQRNACSIAITWEPALHTVLSSTWLAFIWSTNSISNTKQISWIAQGPNVKMSAPPGLQLWDGLAIVLLSSLKKSPQRQELRKLRGEGLMFSNDSKSQREENWVRCMFSVPDPSPTSLLSSAGFIDWFWHFTGSSPCHNLSIMQSSRRSYLSSHLFFQGDRLLALSLREMR